MSEQQVFAQPGASEWTELAPGNRRRVLIHTPELMQVDYTPLEAGCSAV